jgi:hypothetical protein
MAKTITLSDVRVEYWTVNVELQNVTASYRIVDDQSNTWERGEAVFWATMPDLGTDPFSGNPVPPPSNWYLLPAQYVQGLTDLTLDLRQALLSLIQ